jgi:hypothetical protein
MGVKMPRARPIKMEKATYSIEKPNPDWKTKGEKWIRFVLEDWKIGMQFDVAYIPHVPIVIKQENIIHNAIPTRWDLEEIPNAANLCVGGGNNTFRLNGRYKNPGHIYIGSRKNVDLSPTEDIEAIFDLLKIAENIYDSPE